VDEDPAGDISSNTDNDGEFRDAGTGDEPTDDEQLDAELLDDDGGDNHASIEGEKIS
jgi:hypothetical protein